MEKVKKKKSKHTLGPNDVLLHHLPPVVVMWLVWEVIAVAFKAVNDYII